MKTTSLRTAAAIVMLALAGSAATACAASGATTVGSHAPVSQRAAAVPATASVASPDDGDAPVHLELDDIALDSAVEPVGDPGQVLQVPADPNVVGWWRDGVGVGADHGTTVMVAHIAAPDYGNGPMARAGELGEGDLATVTTEDGDTFQYVVDSVHTYLKSDLPAQELFDQDGPARIMLLSCAGQWQPSVGHYDSNIAVELVPAVTPS